MEDLLSRCIFPVLSSSYAQALGEAVRLILNRYSPDGLFLPRGKELLEQVSQHNAHLGKLASDFFTSGDFTERRLLAEQIANTTIGVRGLFEWESSFEEIH